MTMRNDASRDRLLSKEKRKPRAVVSRQGMALTDVDLDHHGAAVLDRVEIETLDIFGSKGKLVYPAGGTGFQISGGAPAANFDIGAGHGYLDGWLLENPAVAKLGTQPHPRTLDTVAATAIIALKALVRFRDPVEDPALADVALGDAQASGRAINDWQVFPVPVQVFPVPVAGGGVLGCAAAADKPEWTNLIAPSTGTMSVIKQAPSTSPDPCSLTPGGGYTRMENLLFRAEIHNGVARTGSPTADGPRFRLDGLVAKFQRQNASLMARIVDIKNNVLTVEPAALDPRRWFAPGGYAEIVSVHDDVDPRAALANERLFRVSLATDDTITLDVLTPTSPPPPPAKAIKAIKDTKVAADGTWFLRLWDAFPGGAGTATVAVSGSASQLIDLGDGLAIQFQGGTAASFRRGDYWTFAARMDGSVAWPETVPGTPDMMSAHGPEIRYAVLATLSGTAAAPIFGNCSIPFGSLTDKLLFYRGGDGQTVFDPAATPGVTKLPQKLRVAVMCGQNPVPGAAIRWSKVGAPDSMIGDKAASSSPVTMTDAQGLCEVEWSIDRTQQLALHRVEATLATSPTTNLANTIAFAATFATAKHIGYLPGACKHLLGIDNVQTALDTLCAKIETRPPVLTLTEIKLLPATGQAFDLIHEHLILNGQEVRYDSFLSGISFGFDKGTPTIAIQPWDPVIEVELDLPYPSTDAQRFYWAMASKIAVSDAPARQIRAPFGFQRVRLAGTVEPAAAQPGRKAGLLWQPSPEAQQFLFTATEHRFGQETTPVLTRALNEAEWINAPAFQPILCRIRVRAPMVWVGDGQQRAYLNAEHLGTRGSSTGRELQILERDPQTAADLDFFFYLTLPNVQFIPIDITLGNLHEIAVDGLVQLPGQTENPT